MAGALRPLLEMIDEYRRSVAAPETSKVLRSYANYTDLDYIKNRLSTMEDDVSQAIYRENKPDTALVDYLDGGQGEVKASAGGEETQITRQKSKNAQGARITVVGNFRSHTAMDEVKSSRMAK